MPLPVITKVWRCAVNGLCPSGQLWVNVHHFRFGGTTPNASDMTNLITFLKGLYNGTGYTSAYWILAECGNNVTTTQIQTYALDGSSAQRVDSFPASGSIASPQSLPSGASVVATHRTATRGRAYRGRTYLPPFNENQTGSDGRLTASVATGLEAVFTEMRSKMLAASWSHVVASYLHSTATDVTTTTVNLDVDSMRARKA